MAIVNATPDSFSGDGLTAVSTRGEWRARAVAGAGADIIDIGGESTRPGHDHLEPVPRSSRVVPIVASDCEAVDVPISIDTSKARGGGSGMAAGARIVNDVRGLKPDPTWRRSWQSKRAGGHHARHTA